MTHDYTRQFSTDAGRGIVAASFSNRYGEGYLGRECIQINYRPRKGSHTKVRLVQEYRLEDNESKIGIRRHSWYDMRFDGEIPEEVLEDMRFIASSVNDVARETVFRLGPENRRSSERIAEYMPENIEVYESGDTTHVQGIGTSIDGFERFLHEVDSDMAAEISDNHILEEVEKILEEERRSAAKAVGKV